MEERESVWGWGPVVEEVVVVMVDVCFPWGSWWSFRAARHLGLCTNEARTVSPTLSNVVATLG